MWKVSLSGTELETSLTVFLQPLFVIARRVDVQVGSHLMMKLPAQLGAGDLVASFARRGEIYVDPHPRHDVLLQSQRRRVKIVDHVFRPERQADRTVDGRDQRRR